jgi:hypothetical protein
MSKRDITEFITEKIVVTFSSRREQHRFLALCQESGLKWISGVDPLTPRAVREALPRYCLDYSYYEFRGHGLTFALSGIYWYVKRGYTPVPASDFLEKENKNEKY